MKKSLFLIVLTALLCLVCALALTACEEEPEAPAPAPEEPAHTHTWGEWIETTAPTCTTQGVKTRACACGQSETGYIPESHLPDGWESDGTYHWQICTRTGCGAQLSKTTHSYGNWVETLAPTCVAEGSHYKTCTTCSHKVTEAIPIDASNHAPAADWTTDGTHHWGVCTRTGCGAAVNKTAHTPAWLSDATNHWKGCTICGYDIVPAAPHTYDAENTCVCGDYKDKGVQFTLSSGTYTVTDYTGTATEVVIPSAYKGVAVTGIGLWAFEDCSNLTTVTLPDSVTSIGEGAFSDCTGLTSVTIPASVTSIGNGVLFGCRGLTSITVASGNTKYHSAGNCVIETATGTLVLGCKNSVIPADGSVTSIGDDAFYGCTGLTSVTIPAGVTSIGEWAFGNCSKLTSITLPASVTSIGAGAFYYTGLTSVTIPASVTSIGSWAFLGCIGLTSATFSNPNGWWYTSSDTATSGTALLAASLSNASTAANYLRSTYYEYYWKRT